MRFQLKTILSDSSRANDLDLITGGSELIKSSIFGTPDHTLAIIRVTIAGSKEKPGKMANLFKKTQMSQGAAEMPDHPKRKFYRS